jgi:hypothetical protein
MPMPVPQAPNMMVGMPQPLNMQMQPVMNESQKYRNEIMNLFMGDKFMKSNEQQKKQLIGTLIFRYVTQLVTEEFSPKITGMIIDLPIADLNYSVSGLETLQVKVRSAVQLLLETGNLTEMQVRHLPVC